MKKTVFTGSGVAIVTPFNDSGIDFDALGKLINWQISEGTDAIIICGTTGESSTMPDSEHLSAIEFAVSHTNKRVPVIAGTGSNDTRHGVELSKEAEKLGADALLLVTPYYNKATQKGLIEHYTLFAKAVDIPLILYNVPSRTGVNILPETVHELSKIENIVAIKEASGNVAQAIKIRALCGDNMDIYSGNDDVIIPLMSIGAKGVISVLANIIPKDTHEMVKRFLDGDIAGATELQIKTFELIEALFCEVNPIPVKTALNLMGKNAGKLRLPLCEMEEKNLAKLKKALANYNLI
mgnify:CR=1 FL=1